MFKKNKLSINPNMTDTLIGEGTVFEGRLKSEASVRIEGQLTGDIDCQGDVVVGEKGSVRSNIAARSVIIAGVVHGNVLTKGKLTITSQGQLYGNTNASSLIIEEGGVFQGMSKMDAKQAAAAAAAPVPAPAPASAPSGQHVPGAPAAEPAGHRQPAGAFGSGTTVVL